MSMTQVIPNTDNLEVAKLAAVVHLFELGKSALDLRDLPAEQREKELRGLYALLNELTAEGLNAWTTRARP